MTRDRRSRVVFAAAAIALLVLSAWPAKGVYTLARRKAYIWFPNYVHSWYADREAVEDSEKHLIFLMADHYEPGTDSEAGARNERWLSKFRPIADRHRDSYGNRFRYSWFYPFDEHQEEVLASLSRAAYDGYGEVELHWHHPVSDSERFPAMLDEALSWFQRYGALISSGPQPRSQFGFIHGVWALDGSEQRCGVKRELDILRSRGCYADFTFSTAGTVAQPRKINAIYYARDTDEPKSYDDGEDARVRRPVEDRLMIFQVPIGLKWLPMKMEYAAVENYMIPTPARIQKWIDANIHVLGRPEWVFVKVYSHGIPSESVILDHHLDRMLSDLESIARERGIQLHYVTAREAYNIVKAAEAGHEGDPETYRDFVLPKPANLIFRAEGPVVVEDATAGAVKLRPLGVDETAPPAPPWNDAGGVLVKGASR